MTPGYKIHIGNGQPKATIGKIVRYRIYNSERMSIAAADLINWETSGPAAPKSGRVFEYQIVG